VAIVQVGMGKPAACLFTDNSSPQKDRANNKTLVFCSVEDAQLEHHAALRHVIVQAQAEEDARLWQPFFWWRPPR
jgi:hypothetical protein